MWTACVCSHGQYAAQQKEVFIRQIKMALEMQLPLVVHCREAEDDCLQILEEVIQKVCYSALNTTVYSHVVGALPVHTLVVLVVLHLCVH